MAFWRSKSLRRAGKRLAAAPRSAAAGVAAAVKRFRRSRLWVKLTVLGVAVGAVAVAGGYAAHRLEKRRQSQIVTQRMLFDQAAAKLDTDAMRKRLDEWGRLDPREPLVGKRRGQLDAGESDPGDPTLVAFFMNHHLRNGRMDRAAAEAEKRVAAEPADWQARCVLAHIALSKKDRPAALKHLEALNRPGAYKQAIEPGPLHYAVQLNRAVGRDWPELRDHLVTKILPILKLPMVRDLPPGAKLQLLWCYQDACDERPLNPEVVRFWASAAKMSQEVLEAAADPATLTQLGLVQNQQLPTLDQFKVGRHLPEEEYAELKKELEERIRATWAKVREKDPKNPMAYLGGALVAVRNNNWADALSSLDAGLAACGDKTELLVAQGRLLQQFDPSLGLNFLERGADRGGEDQPFWLTFVETALNAGRPDKALQACRQVRKVAPDLPWACRLEAQLCLDTGDARGAVEALSAMPEGVRVRDMKSAELYARALGASGAAGKADEFVQKVREAKSPAALAGAARGLYLAGRPADAVALAQAALKDAPENRELWLVVGDAAMAVATDGDAEAWKLDAVRTAVRAYEWVHAREPNNLLVANNLAWLQLKGLRQKDAAWATTAALRASPSKLAQPPEVLETLGAVLLANNQLDDARAVLERATTSSDPPAGCLIHLAQVYLRLNRKFDAEEQLKRATSLRRTPRESAELRDTYQQLRGST